MGRNQHFRASPETGRAPEEAQIIRRRTIYVNTQSQKKSKTRKKTCLLQVIKPGTVREADDWVSIKLNKPVVQQAPINYDSN